MQSGDYISTNMNGSTVEISTKRATINSNAATGEASVTGNDGLATAKNVADAINAATAKAVSQSAWETCCRWYDQVSRNDFRW